MQATAAVAQTAGQEGGQEVRWTGLHVQLRGGCSFNPNLTGAAAPDDGKARAAVRDFLMMLGVRNPG